MKYVLAILTLLASSNAFAYYKNVDEAVEEIDRACRARVESTLGQVQTTTGCMSALMTADNVFGLETTRNIVEQVKVKRSTRTDNGAAIRELYRSLMGIEYSNSY